MNKRNLEKWVTALQSGQYNKEKGRLRGSGYCAMGVLCDVYLQETGQGHWLCISGDLYGFQVSSGEDASTHVLPKAVFDWLGIPAGSLIYGVYQDEKLDVVYLNDSVMLTFPEIAEAIKKEHLSE